jgi:oxygen-independent coproporphyrinogen-3 oxidase
MAGIYIHIPFCKRICSYCDFYKTANVSFVPDYLKALETELDLRKQYLQNEIVETIYLGGGTPSLLTPTQIVRIIKKINKIYQVSTPCEITLEANPDDLSLQYLNELVKNTPVNRISIGIQSFNDKDLLLLNRRHNAAQALSSIEYAREAGFRNISVDLIYGLPGMSTQEWQQNLDLVFSLDIQHLSAYHLSIEAGTALSRMATRGLLKITEEEESFGQFAALCKTAADRAFIHYEISNLAKVGYFSKHNSNYWQQKKYLGIGPSAHSYNIVSRHWNIAHVKKYLAAISNGGIFYEKEELDVNKRYNEYLMVSLRTIQGVNLEIIHHEYGERTYKDFVNAIQSIKSSGHMIQEGQVCKLTEKGWMISDYIISRLMKAES